MLASSSRAYAFLIGLAVAAAPLHPAAAVDHCRTRVLRDGAVFVSARNVVGGLRWGTALGEEFSAIANQGECIGAGGRANRCMLGAPGSPESQAIPGGCVLYLADDSSESCAAAVRGCLPTPPDTSCQIFPADNIWNTDVSGLPVHAMSDIWVQSIGAADNLHPDFGSGLYRGRIIGFPYVVVPAIQPPVPITFLYGDESDLGPYPIPPLVPVEGGRSLGRGRGDAHVLVIREPDCTLYEIFDARSRRRGESWTGGSGAVWDLASNDLRPEFWTSADAAGLPILIGLVRFDEVEAGLIAHALRFSARQTRRAFEWPARHYASSSDDPSLPPMGIRARLKASVDISGFSPSNQVILTALKQYGMMLADNGSPWFLSGTSDPRWDNEELAELKTLHGSDFEFVDVSSLIVDPDSGAVQGP